MKLIWRLGKAASRYKGLYIIAILSTFALTLINLAAPKIMSGMVRLVEGGAAQAVLADIGRLAAILAGLYLLKIAFRYVSNYLAHKAAWNLVQELRVQVYDHIQSLSFRFFSTRQTGDLMSRVVNDTASFELLYAHIIPEMITNTVTFAGVLIVLMTINVQLALLICIPIPFIILAGWFFATKVRPNFRISQKALAELNAKLQDNFSGIREIKSFGQEPGETREVERQAGTFTKAMLHALRMSAVFHPFVEFLSSIGPVIAVGVGALLVTRNQLAVSDIVAFLLYLALLYAPITGLAKLLEDFQQAYAGAERLVAVLDINPEIENAPGAVPIGDVRGEITFDGVDFEYEAGIPVLEDIRFSCRPGQMVALVGPTGVGKTTLTQLISRFYDPVRGRILVDGRDIRDVTVESLRSKIALVLQDTFLFNGTVAENIGYSDPAAGMDDIVAAARAARIHEDIMAMPDGYDTRVGERGMRLSGGQKQRISIARAILRKAAIVILDEATASVDVETEREIQNAIADLAGTRTIIAIAHRLSTIRNADLILVLDDNRIVQQGTHEELIGEEGLYRRLNMSQSDQLPRDIAAS